MNKAMALMAGCVLVGAAGSAWGSYIRDDGTGEGAWQHAHAPGVEVTYLWLKRFMAQPGSETITNIQVMFGLGEQNNGLAFEALVWASDSSAELVDATAMTRAAGVVSGAGALGGALSQEFVTVDVPDVTLFAGQTFYVGVAVYGVTANPGLGHSTLIPFDLDTANDGGLAPESSNAFIGAAGSGFDPVSLAPLIQNSRLVTLGSLSPASRLLVRAGSVPGPGGLALAPVVVMLGARRRRG